MDTKPLCPSCGKPLDTNAPKGLCPECLIKGAFPTGTDTGGKSPRFVPPSLEELARHFPQLEILEFIGQGGMGAVYKARQKQLDRVVALKILPPQVAGGPGFAERFTREARALAKLNHPHIVTLYEFGQTDGLFYFLMEFVDGVNLRQLLNAGRIAPKEALAIVPQICDALQFAHERGIVHRDIKPENILLSREGRVKIADFGIAKMLGGDDPLTASAAAGTEKPGGGPSITGGQIIGTPQYMAPEQVAHPLEVDHRADIYSLGVVFYQMLTGELPAGKFEAPSKKVLIDVRLDEVVLRALEKLPELRYQQVSEVRTMVETIVSSPGGPVPKAPVHEPVLLKISSCYYSTPEYARSFAGSFLYLYCGKGRLELDEEKLSFTSNAFSTVIPLRAIQALRIGNYSRIAKPFGLNYLFVEYVVEGRTEQILLTPARSPFTPTWTTNERVAEWLLAIRQAASRAGGFVAGSPPTQSANIPAGAIPNDPGGPHGLAESPAHFSHAAIIGACWLPLFFVTFLLTFTAHAVQGEYQGPAWWQKLLMILLLPTGFTAPFGTTSLGWIAVSQIRRSAGKLHGLGLAVFDGLFFPLLALDGLIGYAFLYAFLHTPDPSNPKPPALALLTLATIAGLDFLIIRAVWRAVERPIAGSAPKTPTPPRRSSGVVWLMLALCTIPVLALLYHRFASRNGQWQPQAIRITTEAVQNPLASIRITDVTRERNIAIFRIVSDTGFPPHLLTAEFRGPTITNMPMGQNAYRYAGPDLDCLLAPAENAASYGDGTSFTGMDLTGDLAGWMSGSTLTPTRHFLHMGNKQHGPGEFLYGFYLPDDEKAELVVQQARKLYLGITNVVGDRANVLLLFDLKCFAGKDTAGKENWQELTGSLAVTPDFDVAFGPVVEQVLPRDDQDQTACLDLVTGKLVPLPPYAMGGWLPPGAVVPSVLPSGVSIGRWYGYQENDKRYEVAGTGGTSLRFLSNDKWQDMSVGELLTISKSIPIQSGPMGNVTEGAKPFPETFLFRTSEGVSGLVQIVGFTDNPPGVKIRYKLVQNSTKSASALTPPAPPVATPIASYGPMTERTLPLDKGGLTPLFDLDRNEPVPDQAPTGTLDEMAKLKKPGVAIRHNQLTHRFVIYGFSGTVVGETSTGLGNQWEELTDAQALAYVQRIHLNAGRFQFCVSPDDLPQAFFFKTAAGRQGILQITGLTDNPRGVKIRYKLVQPVPPTSTAANNEFGPVIERVLADSKAPFKNESERTNALMMIDLDSGALLSGPSSMWAADTVSQKSWMQTNGVDALCVVPELNGLVCLDMKVVAVPTSAWDESSNVAISDQLSRVEEQERAVMSGLSKDMPPTWLFQTRKGGMGILQITGFADNPRGVKIRYKLVQPAAPSAN